MKALFVHGAGCTPAAFAAQQTAFPDAVAIALPGRWGVAGAPDRIAAFADAVLAHVGAERALLCGHSMGGAIALECALRAPERVAGVALIGSGARLRVAPALFEGLEGDFPAAARSLAEKFFANPTPERINAAAGMLLDVGKGQTIRDFGACDAFDATARLGELRVPLLAVTGDQDLLTPPKFAQFLADRVPHGTARIIEGAGHFAMAECADETNALLASFVARMEP